MSGTKKGLFLPHPGSEAYLPSPDRRRNAAKTEVADDSFRQSLARAREIGAVVLADQVVDLTDQELQAHEAIGKARLQMQS